MFTDFGAKVLGPKTFIFPFKSTDSSSSTPYEVNFPSGTYFIEAAGASGGCKYGGLGGITSGLLILKKPQTFYLYIGGEGKGAGMSYYGCLPGGWNRGGDACSDQKQCSGGGGTDIRLSLNDLYNDRIIVAGGGGGAASNISSEYCDEKYKGGDGGEIGETALGLSGRVGIAYGTIYSKGGTQTEGGKSIIKTETYTNENGFKGIGGKCAGGFDYCGGGGGGYYGGGGGFDVTGGGGGSGFINKEFLKDPSYSSGNIGNGYIKITVSSYVISCQVNTFNSTLFVFFYILIKSN